MKKFSKFLCSITLFIVCLLLSPAKAQAASVDDLMFSLALSFNEEYAVVDCKESASGTLEIPATYNGKPVTTIGDTAFQNCTNLTDITIPNSITSIGCFSFSGCSNLKNVHITDLAAWCKIQFDMYLPDYGGVFISNPLEFADDLYLNGAPVTDLVISEALTAIDSFVFCGYQSLTSVTISGDVQTVGSSAFLNCKNLRYAIIDGSVSTIDYSAFQNCTKLKAVILSNSITKIGGSAFSNCDNLKAVYFKGSQAEWEKLTIESGNENLKNAEIIFNFTGATIPVEPDAPTDSADYLTFVPNNDGQSYTVTSCNAYASGKLTIPNTYNGKPVTAIGANAFSTCSDLTEIIVPDSITTIEKGAFSGCTSLQAITLPFVGDSTKTLSDTQRHFGYYFIEYHHPIPNQGNNHIFIEGKPNYHMDIFKSYGSLEGDLSSYLIPESLKSVTVTGGAILPLVFEDCTNLASVTLLQGVTSIDLRAFSGCANLTTIMIPSSVTQIADKAFASCAKLKTIQFGGSQAQWNKLQVKDLSPKVDLVCLGNDTPQATTSPTVAPTETAPATTSTGKPATTIPPASAATTPTAASTTVPTWPEATPTISAATPSKKPTPKPSATTASTTAAVIPSTPGAENDIDQSSATTTATTGASSATSETAPIAGTSSETGGRNTSLIIAIIVIIAILVPASGVAAYFLIKKKMK